VIQKFISVYINIILEDIVRRELQLPTAYYTMHSACKIKLASIENRHLFMHDHLFKKKHYVILSALEGLKHVSACRKAAIGNLLNF
jgi:hypothetical protein